MNTRTARGGLCVFLLAAALGGLPAQERAPNTITAGVNLWWFFMPGFVVQYERALGGHFAVAVETGTEVFIMPFFQVHGRWYPAGVENTFYADLGVGTTLFVVPTLTPAVGWKFTMGSFVLDIGGGVDLAGVGMFIGSVLPSPKLSVRAGAAF